MQKNEIQILSDRLSKREAYQLSFYNYQSEAKISSAINQEYLDANHGGSLVEYLNDLKLKGIQKVQITQRLANGSGEKAYPGSLAVNINLSGSKKAETSENMIAERPVSALAGPGANYGLSAPQILSGHIALSTVEVQKQQISKLEQELEQERAGRRKYKKKYNNLKLKNIQHGIDEEKTPGPIDKLLVTLAEKPEIIGPLLSGFKSGLNGPAKAQSNDGLTEVQSAVVETVKNFPDEINLLVHTVFENYTTNNTAFINEFVQLLEKHKLKVVKDG